MKERFDSKITLQANNKRIAWNDSYSPYGYKLSEVISAVGKEIRRGNDELASFWAYQMMLSGAEAEEFLWERYKVITLEDVGVADPNALVVINNAEKLYYELPSKSFDRFATGVFAAVYLSQRPKTRYAPELFEDMRYRLQEGSLRPKIPDYALDKHLPHARKELGRDELHYLQEGAKLANEDTSFSLKYRQRLIERAEKKRRESSQN